MTAIMLLALGLQLPPLGGGIPGGDAAMRPPMTIRQGRAAKELQITPVAPIGEQGDWFPQDAYPADARKTNEQGRVSVSLEIDATGKPVGCQVTSSSGSASLDKTTCDLALANGRFTPARVRGKPIASRFAMRNVAWILAAPDPIDLTAGEKVMAESTIEVTLSADGTAITCKATLVYPPGAPDPCANAPIGLKSAPMTRNGVPVSGKVIMRQSATLVPDMPSVP